MAVRLMFVKAASYHLTVLKQKKVGDLIISLKARVTVLFLCSEKRVNYTTPPENNG